MKDPYFSLPGISNSALSAFKRSPKHYLHQKDNPIEATADMNLGSLIHCIVFEPQNYDQYFLLMDESTKPFPAADYRNGANRDWRDGLQKRAVEAELILIDAKMKARAEKAKESLLNDKVASELITAKDNEFESGITWSKSKSQCKGKLDVRNPYFIADLKTTKDADPYGFKRLIFQRDIHRQIGMYLDGDAGGQFDPKSLKEGFVIALENDEPYGVSVHRLTPEVIIDGYKQYMDLLYQFQTCLDTNTWPGYEFKAKFSSEGIFDVELPEWRN